MPPKPAPVLYTADEDLMLYDEASGTMPTLAYRAGQRIAASTLAAHPEWESKVTPLNPPKQARSKPAAPKS